MCLRLRTDQSDRPAWYAEVLPALAVVMVGTILEAPGGAVLNSCQVASVKIVNTIVRAVLCVCVGIKKNINCDPSPLQTTYPSPNSFF